MADVCPTCGVKAVVDGACTYCADTAAPATNAPATGTPATDTDDVLDGNAADVIAAINEIDDQARLTALLDLETEGKNRKTVLAALAARHEALQ